MKLIYRIVIYSLILIGLYHLIAPRSINEQINTPNESKETTQIKQLKTEDPVIQDPLMHFTKLVNIPRVSGSKGNLQVQSIIMEQLKKTGFEIEQDTFEDKTPIGTIKFNNIIGKKFKSIKKYKDQKAIILAAHFDSKYFKSDIFYGTTDSATSVGLLLSLAEKLKTIECEANYELYFVFFDGEEAFEQWTRTDSLYGSRHLSEKWKDDLKKFDYMILFDLLGAQDAQDGHIRKTPYSDEQLYKKFVAIDETDDSYQIFGGRTYKQFDDDHRPFLEKGLKVLHIIPHEFPAVWHTVDDTIDNVDMNIMRNYEKMTWHFLQQELQLEKCE